MTEIQNKLEKIKKNEKPKLREINKKLTRKFSKTGKKNSKNFE